MKRIKLFLVTLTLALFPLKSFAQSSTHQNDVAVWISSTQFNDPSITDEGDRLSFELNENTGYGLSYNRYWTAGFSTELSLQKLGADVDIAFNDEPSVHAGDLDATAWTGIAQYHFRRATRFSPYVGLGAAYLSGEFNPADVLESDGRVEFDNETSLVTNFGADINLTDRIAIALDAKYMKWEPRERDDDALDRLDVSPLIVSAGLRVRF
ncbi:MAG: outer membrane beta-barrel protein [Acidobacteriota bacterium]|nr:outer membrane beta-barrel protein [Acidobacteriota bacterium]